MKTKSFAAWATSMLLACSGATGPAGPEGPQGNPGPAGEAGPPGSSGTNADGGVLPLTVDALQLPGPAYYPESLNAGADGTLYVGSLVTGSVVKFAPGEVEAKTFLASGGAVKGVAGVLVDDKTKSLFVCAVDPTFQSATSVRRFDLATGTLAATFTFPQNTNAFPNDMTFDSAHHLYVTDSFGGKVFVVKDVTADATLQPWATDVSLAPVHPNAFGADGITFDGTSALYVNNNDTGTITKLVIDSSGNAGAITTIAITPALKHPDGQRQIDASTLLVADNAGALLKIALSTGTATPIDTRLEAPTSVVTIGASYWVSEGQITTSLLNGQPPHLPFLVDRVDVY